MCEFKKKVLQKFVQWNYLSKSSLEDKACQDEQ